MFLTPLITNISIENWETYLEFIPSKPIDKHMLELLTKIDWQEYSK